MLRRLPPLNAVRAFEAVARTGSVTRGARELSVTQGAVSRHVGSLEQWLGAKLFLRTQRGLTLTPQGSTYFRALRGALDQIDHATRQLQQSPDENLLRLKLPPTFAIRWLIPRLPDFTRAHSEITLNFATRVGSVDFKSMPVDASLEFGDGKRAGLHNDFVLPLAMAPYAAPAWIAKNGKSLSSSTPMSELVHHTTVLDAWKNWFDHAGIQIGTGQEGPRYELMSMALNAAVAGLGAVLLPDFMAGDAVATGRLRRLSKKQWVSTRGYYLVYPEESSALEALTVFRAWLLAQVSAERA